MTGYVNEILGDDRLWDTGLLESTLAFWPLQYEMANLAILNRTVDKTLVIRTLNTRPYTGPCGTFPTIQIGRITGYTGGETVTPVSLDSNNAACPLEVKYRPSSVTETAGTRTMTQWVNTGMNLTRAQQWSRTWGCSKCGFDQSEVYKSFDADTQKITLREGEGAGLFFKTNSGPNIFMLSAYVQCTLGTYLINDVVEPLYMAGACFLSMFNPAGSGHVITISRLQAREVGSDEMPKIDFFKICTILGAPDSVQVTWADSSEAIPEIDVKKNCLVKRDGMDTGSIITSPHFRYIMGGEAPYGPNTANGGSVARRGKWSHDMRYQEDATALRLGPGKGIAVVMRNPSVLGYSELIANFAVESAGAGVYPAAANVRDAITYGPTGADYTGNIVLPSANDARMAVSYGSLGTEYTGTIELPSASTVQSGVSYGANGTEVTGTLVATGGGGGRHIVISGGWN